MVYEILLAYADGDRTVKMTVQDVHSVKVNETTHIFCDGDGRVIFSATNDALVYAHRISLG